MIRLLDDLFRRVQRLSVISVLNALIDALEAFVNQKVQVNWIVHSLVVGFEVHGHNFTVSINQVLKYIEEYDS